MTCLIQVSVISYCGSARTEITRTSSKNDIMSKLNLIYDEEMYNNDYKSYYKRNDVTKIGRGLGSATNIQQGLKQVSEIAEPNMKNRYFIRCAF